MNGSPMAATGEQTRDFWPAWIRRSRGPLGPAIRLAHPRTEHLAPLFVALGAALDRFDSTSVVDGFWYGMSKRSFQFH